MSRYDDDIKKFERTMLEDRLAMLNDSEMEGWKRLAPKMFPPDGFVPDDKLRAAAELCDRTIAKRPAT